ncbi:SpvB/TcaC N-terminal domain-containing protein [Pseudomonas sp. MYb118]|uniref:SpvB/TcaC N-terminal domain-containing protein n=1 Tax=Pseudomonas sp. MYb118 TaxID=1848720 RepID=UPI0034CE4315
MATEEQKGTINIAVPVQPKMGGAIASFGSWSPAGPNGSAEMSLPLPISSAPNRSLVPQIGLRYSSQVGSGNFGMGWHADVMALTVRTSKGVPVYEKNKDIIVGPGGEVLMPELGTDGEIIVRTDQIGTTHYQVLRYQTRNEGAFNQVERWFNDQDVGGFFRIQSADGSTRIYGKSLNARRAEPRDDNQPTAVDRTGVWMLEEESDLYGQHIVCEYKADTGGPEDNQGRDYRSQRYLHRVLYGNAEAEPELYSLKAEGWADVHFLFHLLFDYGEREHDLMKKPVYGPPYSQPDDQYGEWKVRSDPFTNYDYGFGVHTRRLCRQVLMFHHFRVKETDPPFLVQRLFLQHQETDLGYTELNAAHFQAYDHYGRVESRPPMEFRYAPFEASPDRQPGWQAFPEMPGLNDGQRYQLVDLYNKGMPGILYRDDKAWYFSEPLRKEAGTDEIRYGGFKELPSIPVGDSRQPIRQTLSDLNGDGKLEFGYHSRSMNGFISMTPERDWSQFVSYKSFPAEFFHPKAQMVDLIGDGRTHVAMIGNNSVRLYTNLGNDKGFTSARDVPHEGDYALPQPGSDWQTEVVGFGDLLGSGKQHLFRLRHNRLECWPNLGHGRFGQPMVLQSPTCDYDEFNAARVLMADTDGSGAGDLIYVESDRMRVFMNHAGKGFATESIDIPWPQGVRYDSLCQVTTADLQGLGCTSIVLTVPHMSPRHWRYDFVRIKPYLINRSNNNMGAVSTIRYRSSAQEQLDDEFEQHLIDRDKVVVSKLPFPMHLVKQQNQLDEITGNQLAQLMSYREGFYDPIEREFRGFRLLMQQDTEGTPAQRKMEGFTAPVLTKTWYSTGEFIDPPRDGYYTGDDKAVDLKSTRLERYHTRDRAAELFEPDEETAAEIARTLAGSVLRTEVFAADDPRVPYLVTENRLHVRLLRAKGEHDPYSVLQAMGLESISYQYEPQLPDDPRCEHQISLSRDQYGNALHACVVYYARRKTPENPPFEDEHENRYWSDAHDEAQQCHYMTETKAELIHLYDEANWKSGMPYRLAIPFRERTNALVLEKAELIPENINHEYFVEHTDEKGEWAQRAELASLSMQFYVDPATNQTLPKGVATVEALPGYVEIAELDRKALGAYDKLKDENGNMPFNLKEKLESREVGYHIMDWFLPEVDQPAPEDPGDAKNYLWSIHRGFLHYLDEAGFYNVDYFQQTRSHGITKVTHDAYYCVHESVELPDGCITRIKDIDYYTFLPKTIIDPNQNLQQASYNAFGDVKVTSFFGTELGQPVGFYPLDDYVPPEDQSPGHAIENPYEAIGNYASALFTDLFAWMGRVPATQPLQGEWYDWALAAGFILPSGHLCDRARQHLLELPTPNAHELLLKQYVDSAIRQPRHAAVLLADRYPGDPEKQVRIAITHHDGFDRELQTKQEVEPGEAWVVLPDGTLKLKADGRPETAQAARRFRVSARQERNNKGLPVRIYRPYFADSASWIKDESLREVQHHDRQYYDSLGRPTETILAKKMPQGPNAEPQHLREEIKYYGWFNATFDANDNFNPPPAKKRKNPWTLH